jgi:gliding motility-associated-like protein
MFKYALRKSIITVSLLILMIHQTRADHIMGGQLEMKVVNSTTGEFRVILKLYYDDLNATAAAPKNTYRVGIYRKSDNVLMTSFQVTYQSRKQLVYTNQACANQRSLKTSELMYWYDATLSPSSYNNIQGYYMISEFCCRNSGADNIINPSSAGTALYLEFPSLLRGGTAFVNSSPSFDLPDGEYICRNDPFRFSSQASDADNDILEYEIVTPYAGNADFFSGDKISPGPTYPLVAWKTGFDATKSIPGSPPLAINNKGLMTVTATGAVDQLYVFCVQVKEFRMIGGIKTQIGLVRRDFQLFVIDCPTVAPPVPVITSNGNPASNNLALCAGQTIKLDSDVNSLWTYQWERDDENIIGASTPSITISDAGVYRLNTSLKNSCSKSTASQTFTVTFGGSPFDLTMVGGKNGGFCKGKSVDLKGNVSGSTWTYAWSKDGINLPDITEKITANTAGDYVLKTNNLAGNCLSTSNVFKVKEHALPIANFTVSKSTICVGESFDLIATKYNNAVYDWKKNGVSLTGTLTERISQNDAGNYQLSIKDENDCEAISSTETISQVSAVVMTFDPIALICNPNNPPIPLVATPSGGIFSGSGIESNTKFNPKTAGVGTHTLKYTLSGNTNSCLNGTKDISVIVSQLPQATLPPVLSASVGGTIELNGLSPEGTVYSWSPTGGLTNPTDGKTKLKVTTNATYKLNIKNQYGCENDYNVAVVVVQKLLIPNAFTPNNDTQNDTWELFGINQYPHAEVFIYNRWGEPVFYSKGYSVPFDGKTNGGVDLPIGDYTYLIKIIKPVTDEVIEYRGALSLFR